MAVGVPLESVGDYGGVYSTAPTTSVSTANESGAVYVYAQTKSGWAFQAYIKAWSPVSKERFGSSVALSEDGSTLAVGAPGHLFGRGSVAIYTRSETTWRAEDLLQDPLAANDDGFGSRVALSGNGKLLAIGSKNLNGAIQESGAVHVYATNTLGIWEMKTKLTASNPGVGDGFGLNGLAVDHNGDTIAVGAPLEDSQATGLNGNQLNNSATDAGAVYVFERDASNWSQQAYIKASNTGAGDRFGSVVSLNDDGKLLAISAPFEGSKATGLNGDQADNTAAGAGAVYLWAQASGVWSQRAYIKASNTETADVFGTSMALSANGNALIVGAADEDSSAIGIDGNQSNNTAAGSGAAYLFIRSGDAWSQKHYIKGSNTTSNDRFGQCVALSRGGEVLVVGASGEDGAATGVNGDQTIRSANDAGAVYIWKK